MLFDLEKSALELKSSDDFLNELSSNVEDFISTCDETYFEEVVYPRLENTIERAESLSETIDYYESGASDVDKNSAFIILLSTMAAVCLLLLAVLGVVIYKLNNKKSVDAKEQMADISGKTK